MSLRVKFFLCLLSAFALLFGVAVLVPASRGLLFLIGALALGASFGVFERLVLSRLKKIRAEMDEFSIKWKPEARVSQGKGDEITELSKSLKTMLNALSEFKDAEERLVKMAYHDSKTALPNRHYFMEELDKELRQIRENPSYTFCVVFANMDKFKLINEQLGALGADKVITEVVKRVRSITEGFASMFRMEGDEFSIIIRGTNSKDYIDSGLQRIRRLLNNPVSIDGKTVFTSATFGAVLDIQGSNDASQVMTLAKDALAAGKKAGMGSIAYISAVEGLEALMQQSQSNLMAIREDMRRSLSDLEFVPYFQPIYKQSPSLLAGFEALARWVKPSRITPSETFVRQAEEIGLITDIDKHVISEAVKITKKWAQTFPEFPFFVCVNASGASLRTPRFAGFVIDCLEKAGLAPEYFMLELTEKIFIENFENTIENLNLLKDRGIKLVLDDFGAGYSSLRHVSQLPLNYIKIDKSFIYQLFSSSNAMNMVKSTIDMAGALDIGVVAEGVETVDQLNWLAENKNTQVQGYFFSAPLPPEEAEQLLADANAFYAVNLSGS